MNKEIFGKILKRAVLGILTMAMILGASTSGSAANLFLTNSSIFLDHGFISSKENDAYVSNVVVWLRQRDFKYQLENVTALNSDGTVNPTLYAGLSNWVQFSRETDPSQKIIMYISGTETEVNGGQTVWSNIANVCQMFLTNYDVDGINLDFEPFETTVTNYIQFFKTIRNEVGTNAFLSLDYTATGSATWAPADYKAASSYINWMMPMLYDTSSTNIFQYDAYIASALTYQYTNLAPGSQLCPIIPYYATDPYHDTNVENISTAAGEITNLINSGQINIGGVGVWWYYGWDATADVQWSNSWVNVQLPASVSPIITSISPTNGPTTGGTLMTINGANFVSGATVQFGSAAPVTANYANYSQLTVTLPAQPAGLVTVTVVNPGAQSGTNTFTYAVIPPPAVTSLSPVNGTTAGGTLITITGSNFVSGDTVQFGVAAPITATFIDSTNMTVTTVATPPGVVNFAVTDGYNQSSTLTNGYTFLALPVSGVWTNVAGGAWTTGGNWLSGTAANGTGTADFSQMDITNKTAVTVSTVTIGNLIFGDANTNSAAGWVLTGGTLTLYSNASSPTITVDALGGTNNVTINSVLSSSNGFVKAGPGPLVLNAANTFNGNVTVQQGVMILKASGSYGNSPAFVIGSSNGSDASLLSSGATMTLSNALQLGTNAVGALAIGTSLGGSGTLDFDGGLAMNGDNLTVQCTTGGGVYFRDAGITGSGNILFSNNSPNSMIEVESSAGINNIGTVTVVGTNTASIGFDISAIGANVTAINYDTSISTAEFATITVGGSGKIINSASTLSLPAGDLGLISGSGPLTFNCDSSGNLVPTWAANKYTSGTITNSGTGTGMTTISGNIIGTSSVVQNSATSPLILTGTNSNSGATFVQGGTLLVNGQGSSSSVVTVASGGTLGGTGTIKGPVRVQVGGTLAPGTNDGFTIGTMTNTGSLTLNGNLFFKLNTSLAQSNDFVTGTTLLTNLGTGTLTVTNVGPALMTGETFYLFSQPLMAGSNLTIVGPANFINNLAVNGSIQVGVSGPTQPAAISSMVQSGRNLTLVWQGGANQNCVLLASTNIALPAVDWTPVTTNAVGANGLYTNTLPIDPSQPQQFYRLVIPQN